MTKERDWDEFDKENIEARAAFNARVDAARAKAVARKEAVFAMIRARGLIPGAPHGVHHDAEIL